MLTVRLDTEVQIRRERLTRLALGVLREEPSHGYELMDRLDEFGFEQINSGTLYRTLRQMELLWAAVAGRYRTIATAAVAASMAEAS